MKHLCWLSKSLFASIFVNARHSVRFNCCRVSSFLVRVLSARKSPLLVATHQAAGVHSGCNCAQCHFITHITQICGSDLHCTKHSFGSHSRVTTSVHAKIREIRRCGSANSARVTLCGHLFRDGGKLRRARERGDIQTGTPERV